MIKLSAWARAHSDVIQLLESKNNTTVNWFTNNKLIVNPDKFWVIILDKKKSDYTNKQLVINNQQKPFHQLNISEFNYKNQLTFNYHICNTYWNTANQLKALIRLEIFLNYKARKFLTNIYIVSNFNYSPLMWTFLNKIEFNIGNCSHCCVFEPYIVLKSLIF